MVDGSAAGRLGPGGEAAGDGAATTTATVGSYDNTTGRAALEAVAVADLVYPFEADRVPAVADLPACPACGLPLIEGDEYVAARRWAAAFTSAELRHKLHGAELELWSFEQMAGLCPTADLPGWRREARLCRLALRFRTAGDRQDRPLDTSVEAEPTRKHQPAHRMLVEVGL